MKGITRALARTPHMVTAKVGMSKKSSDPEFDDYHRKFTTLEAETEKLLKDCGVFTASVVSLLSSGQNFATSFANLFQPLAGEYDVMGKHPAAANTIRNVNQYQSMMEDLRTILSPELELISSRIVSPAKELQIVLKHIRKQITKRDHKLIDYDRFNNSLTKLREKKEKSLSDEKNLFKLEQDFEAATNEYETLNSAMKADLPRFMVLATQFIDPLFHSFYYMQLNIFYLMLDKFNGFASGKYETGGSGAQIADAYEASRTDAIEQVEALNITKRMVSTAKLMAQKRDTGSLGSLGRSASSSSAPPVRTPSATFAKKSPPPPPSPFGSTNTATPPPYSAGAGSAGPIAAANATAAKRAPPPPPVKPKPRAEPPVQYVVALYDFAAQADGDLEFSAGDRIELVERTGSTEDWWTGRLNGRQGVFPGNYVQES
ncbi:BAR-domain-containing protein [Sistotremastrum niveocremeum HHB9708]|uniref:BAR-domain-containing protein n=2 Tax=Sistotremastraceae TaxID=3402574 RepID=A0A164R9T3_9AGAM|nr:BAR-domain-containing protein [Sistotremastrum niveocremeum HHB9708]KZT42726.1 BAR-domain-containing protein [Sistotremastrum suecicum HHB10207 ss-3]